MAEHLMGAQNIRVEYPTKVVLDGVTAGVGAGDRLGIVGRNGDGKSTLMRVLLGKQEPDEGLVTRRTGLRVGMLEQEDHLDPDLSVKHAVVGDLPEFEWAGNARIREVLDGLLGDISLDAKISSLSGGQARRVALAALLIGDWDVIGLDEPTNHLDIEGIHWLARHLKNRWPRNSGAVLIITHDRWFLDAVTEDTWEVHDGIVEPFEGGYAAYVLQRVERDRMAAASEAKRQNLLRKELAWLRRGAPARTSKPKFRLDAAAELISNEPPVRDSVELTKIATARIGKKVVDLVDVSAGYGDKEILHDVTWRIAPGERTGILGANGAGKSTLLKLIAGELTPTAGHVRPGKTVKIAVLDQRFSQLDEIRGDRVREVLARTKTSFVIDGKDVTPAQMLERLGFPKQYLSSPVKDLSGGQKRRVQLLLVLLSEPNVLILDEPTNDLDTDMLTAVEDLLDSWAGTLIVVSHDRYLLERVTDQQYAILDGTLRHLPGGVDEYLKIRAQEADRAVADEGDPSPSPSSSSSQEGHSPLSGAELHATRKALASVERRMDRVAKKVEKAQHEMAQHDQSDYQGLQELSATLRSLEAEMTELEEQWLEASEIIG